MNEKLRSNKKAQEEVAYYNAKYSHTDKRNDEYYIGNQNITTGYRIIKVVDERGFTSQIISHDEIKALKNANII